MRTRFENVNINKISFETGDNNVYVNTTIKRDQFKYQSQLILNFSDLNVLINKLQEQNPDCDISSLFEEDKLYDGSSMYTLNTNKYGDNCFELNQLEFVHEIKQIRA
jgi:hypothetical protein